MYEIDLLTESNKVGLLRMSEIIERRENGRIKRMQSKNLALPLSLSTHSLDGRGVRVKRIIVTAYSFTGNCILLRRKEKNKISTAEKWYNLYFHQSRPKRLWFHDSPLHQTHDHPVILFYSVDSKDPKVGRQSHRSPYNHDVITTGYHSRSSHFRKQIDEVGNVRGKEWDPPAPDMCRPISIPPFSSTVLAPLQYPSSQSYN